MTEDTNYQTLSAEDIDTTDEKKLSLDDILDRIGYTKFHYIMICIVGLSLVADGVEIFLIFFLGPVFKEVFNVNDTFISAIISSLLVGMGIGALSSGFIIKRFERRKPFIFFLSLISVFGTICILIDNGYWFMFCRFIICICIGVLLNFTNSLCEILPTKFRDFIMNAVHIFFHIGRVYWTLVYFIVTQYQPAIISYKIIIIISCIPMYILTILVFFYFKESPRIFLWNNKSEEAFDMINEIAKEVPRFTLTEEEKVYLVHNIEEEKKKHPDYDSIISFIGPLFSKQLIRITLLCSFLWILNLFIIYGNSYALPLILQKQDESLNIHTDEELKEANNDFVKKMLISILVPIPALFIAGYLTSIHYFGRINTIIIGFIAESIFSLLMAFDLPRVYIYASFLTFFNVISFNITKLYTIEVYNTNLRDSGYGFVMLLRGFGL
jgi:putative MFS transporter